MRSRTTGRFTAPLVAALAVAALTAGCGGGDEPEERPEAGEEASEGVDASRVSPDDLPEVPDIAEPVGAVGDLDLGDCETGPGEVTVTGEVTNSGEVRRDVLVVLSWTNDTSDVLGRGVAVVEDLEPGDSAEVTLDAEVADGATQCVPNVQRGVVRG